MSVEDLPDHDLARLVKDVVVDVVGLAGRAAPRRSVTQGGMYLPSRISSTDDETSVPPIGT